MFFGRVTPILKDQVDGGKINLTAIVNTHQSVPLGICMEGSKAN